MLVPMIAVCLEADQVVESRIATVSPSETLAEVRLAGPVAELMFRDFCARVGAVPTSVESVELSSAN